MKSDPRSGLLDDDAVAPVHAETVPDGLAVVAGHTPGATLGLGIWLIHAILFVVVPLAVLMLSGLAALFVVRFGADLRIGLDPWTAEVDRPRLPIYELAGRGVAADVLRQLLIMACVIGLAWWVDRAAWRRRLALTRPAEKRARFGRLWLLMAVWPVIHILWVTETSKAMNGTFGQGIRLSPFLVPLAVKGWFAYVAVLAPVAEELLMRGEAFARASRIMRPAGVIVATALLFSLAHLSESGGFARPISLLPLAITLGWLRWRTGRLWPCMLLHGWSNLVLVLYLLWPIRF